MNSASTTVADVSPRSRAAGLSAMVVAAGAFSWGFILVKAIGLPPSVLSLWRVGLGALGLTLTALVLRVPWPRQWQSMLGAGLTFGVHQLLFIAASQRTSIAIVTLITATQPLLVAMVSRKVIGERASPALFGCSLIALFGIALVLFANANDQSRSLSGDLLAVANAVAFTGYFLFAKRARVAGAPTLTFTASFLLLSLLVIAPAMLATTPLTAAVIPNGKQSWLLVLLAFGPGNGHLLVNWAHSRVSAAFGSLALLGVPLFATIWAHLIFGEPLGVWHVLGIAVVLAAVEAGRRFE
jgi:drug/metabolite transporter (DMT)-like permease